MFYIKIFYHTLLNPFLILKVLYSAKTRAEKSGGGRKPHPQKGLGKARQGSIRAPHYIGGKCSISLKKFFEKLNNRIYLLNLFII